MTLNHHGNRSWGQAVPGIHLNRNSLLSREFWFRALKVRPDPVIGPRAPKNATYRDFKERTLSGSGLTPCSAPRAGMPTRKGFVLSSRPRVVRQLTRNYSGLCAKKRRGDGRMATFRRPSPEKAERCYLQKSILAGSRYSEAPLLPWGVRTSN